MSAIFGLGNGLPISTRASSAERPGAHEGIGGFSASSAAPVSSIGAIASESGSSKSQLSDAVQSVMLEFQNIGSGSSSFAAAMDAVKANDSANGIKAADDVVSSNSDATKDLASDEPDAEDEFKSALRDSSSPPTKDENRNEKAEIEKRKERQERSDAAQEAATDLPEDVAGLDSRVAAQVMSGQPARQQPALAA